MTEAYEIIGAGGAGMRAALGMAASGLRTACVTKVSAPTAAFVSTTGPSTCSR